MAMAFLLQKLTLWNFFAISFYFHDVEDQLCWVNKQTSLGLIKNVEQCLLCPVFLNTWDL